jgi:hypothetical protein
MTTVKNGRRKYMILKKFLIALIVVCACSLGKANAGEVAVGLTNMVAGHSEGAKDRCMNDGLALDLEYRVPFTYDFHKYLGVEMTPGVMLRYANFETAYRMTSTSPESQQKRESGVALSGTLRPTIRVWRAKVFKLYGYGLDYNQPDGAFGFGYFKNGEGVGLDITDSITLEVSRRKFVRRDGTTYRFMTGTFTMTF